MKDIIDNLYDFMEDPTSQLKEDVEDEDLYILGIFLSNNLIATRMITTSIQKDEMYDITHLYGKSESIKILSGFLNEDLRNIPNIEQYKIDICNKKLRDLVDLIREEKEIKEEKQREEKEKREEKQREDEEKREEKQREDEEKIRKQKQEEKESGRMGRDDKKRQQKEEEMKKKRQQKEEEMKKKRQQKEEEMKKKRREKEEEKEKKKKEKEEEKQKKREGEDDKTRKKREAREAYAKKKKEKKEKNTEEQRGAFDSAWQEDLRRWQEDLRRQQEDLRRQQENNDNKHREDLEKNIDLIRGDKYRCVVPFKRSTADTKDRLASCKTTGNFSKGFNRFFEGRQPCIEYCNTE